MKRIVLGCPYKVNTSEGMCRLVCDVSGDFLNESVWYEVANEMEDALAEDRLDGFVVGMLPYIMYRSKTDDKVQLVLKSPISERLYFQLKEELIPALAYETEWYNDFEFCLEAGVIKSSYEANSICTGVSGGIDSFYTLLKSRDEFPKEYKVTHGLFICMEDRKEVNDAEVKNAVKICKELNLEFVRVNTNICGTVYESRHDAVSSFAVPSVPLVLGRLFKVYYHSSSHVWSEFNINPEGMSMADPLLCSTFSTETLSMYCYSMSATRAEKTEYIGKDKIVQDYLLVCGENEVVNGKTFNCSKCSKCTMTMIDLDILGRLDDFKNVFDIKLYRKNPLYYWGYVFYKEKGGLYISGTLEMAKRKKYKIPRGSRLSGIIKIIRRGFKRTNPYQHTFRP